jgi:hypothetical protein
LRELYVPFVEQFVPLLLAIEKTDDAGQGRNFVSPQTRLFDWAKRALEHRYVRAYR